MELKEQEEIVEEEIQFKEVKGLPKFIKEDNKGSYHVTLKSGKIIILEDIAAKKMLRAEKLATKNGELDASKYQLSLISEMSGIGELELQEIKASEFNRLKIAMTKILDFDDFL